MRHALIFLVLAAGCYTPPTAPASPSTPQVIAGDGQTGVPGYRLVTPVTIKVTGTDGKGISGDTIFFTPSDAAARVEPMVTPTSVAENIEPTLTFVTDTSGSVTVYWRLGATLGTQSLTARATGVPGVDQITLSATARSNLVQSIAGGDGGLCAVDLQGRLACWIPPHLYVADAATRFTPVMAPVTFTQVGMIDGNKGCAVASTGRPWCFALDLQGNVLGLAELPGTYPAFAQIAADGSVGGDNYCGMTALGATWCWGGNAFGELGDGTTLARAAPVAVATTALFAQVDLSGNTSCGVTAAGAAWCWGRNGEQQAGSATLGAIVTSPVAISTALQFIRVRSISTVEASCGFVSGGGMYCWGATGPAFARNAIPTIAAASPPAIDIMETEDHLFGQLRTYVFDQHAGLDLASFTGGVPIGGGTAVTLSSIGLPFALLQSISLAHGQGYVCGTATFGTGTLCPSEPGYHTDFVPAGFFLRPAVVGVPFP